MFAAAVVNRNQTPTHAGRLCAAVSQAVEPLERRVLFAGGDLDALFGAGGTVSLDLLGHNDFGNAVAVQADGKILVGGCANTGGGTDVALARFNADGTLDLTFGGGDGVVLYDLGTSTDSAVAIAVQSDGKIVVGGQSRSSGTSNDFAVMRFNANGSVDTSFGFGGMNGTDVNRTPDIASGMALMPDGKIVLVGSTVTAGQTQMLAVRYTASGMQDITFGAGGIKIVSYPTGSSEARSVRALSNGQLVMGGTLMHDGAADSDFAAVRLLANGNLDTTFGAAGWVRVDLGGSQEVVSGVDVMADGRVVLAGTSMRYESGMTDVGVVRLTVGGQLDETFNGGAVVVADVAGEHDTAASVLVQGDGKVFVAGTANVGGVAQALVARFRANGMLDTSWGGDGVVVFGAATGAAARGMALDAGGRLVVAGNVHNGANADFSVARFLNPPNLAPVAHAGGAYTVRSGDSVVLDGSGSSDAEGAIASYAWDFDYDGSSFDSDGTGIAPTFVASGYGVRTVALLVTDADGATHLVTTTLTILAPPTAHAGGPYIVESGSSVVLDGSGSSDLDGSIVTYEWDFNYDGSSFDVDASGVAPTFSTSGLSGGVRTIALRVTDSDGLVHVMTTTVTVNVPPPPPPVCETPGPGAAGLVPDPCQPGGKMLLVMGTSQNDVVHVKLVDGRIEVRMNGKKLGTFSGMTRIVVRGGEGNDVIDASESSVPVALFGGAGNDNLVGSRFSDVLVGGSGNDHVNGGGGDDLLVGCAGKDELDSRLGNDLMVGGSFKFGESLESLSTTLNQWKRPTKAARARLHRSLAEVVDDRAADRLRGTPGRDMMFAGKGDKVVKLKK